jgi:hypothetical protein
MDRDKRNKLITIYGVTSYSVLFIISGLSYGGLFSFLPKPFQLTLFLLWFQVLFATVAFASFTKPYSKKKAIFIFLSISFGIYFCLTLIYNLTTFFTS